MHEENIKDVLNRSRRDRLTKAAKQGYGPWAELSQRSRSSAEGDNAAASSTRSRPTPAVSENAPRAPLVRQQRTSTTTPRSGEDEPDLDGFLAPKHPGKSQKKVQMQQLALTAPQAQPSKESESVSSARLPQPPVSQKEVAAKLELKISTGTNQRTVAANAGARPKAASRPIIDSATEELIQRQLEERAAEEFQAMQARARKTLVGWQPPVEEDSDGESPLRQRHEEDSRSRSGSERRQGKRESKKEAKKRREEWRKTWKDEKKRKDREPSRSKSKEPEAEEQKDSDGDKSSDEPLENVKNRALTWSMLNSHGVTTARDAQRKPVGQMSDAELDRKLREAQVSSVIGQSQKLMSEEEVIAKLQKKRYKPNPPGAAKKR